MIAYFAKSDITCYVLRGSQGDLLIDTGLPQTWRAMQRWLTQFDVRWVLLTHAHPDHDWNAAKLQRMGAKLILSERDRDLRQNFLSQRVHPTAPRYRLRNVMQCVGGAVLRSPHYEPDIWLKDSDSGLLRTLGLDAEIIPLPGHTLGSVGVLHGRTLLCGDAFTMLWKRPDITPHAHDIAAMQDSLRRMLALDVTRLCCGHGLPVSMTQARPVIEAYLHSCEKT